MMELLEYLPPQTPLALVLVVILLLGLLLSVSSRLRASRAALADSERRMLLALDAAGHGVWEWSGETGRVFYSRRWKEMLGYQDAEVTDDPREWVDRLHPEDRATALRRIEQHAQSPQPFYSSIYRLRTKSGDWRWVLGQGVALERDAAGRAVRTIGTHTDITRWREAEQAREVSQRRFEATFEQAAVGMAHIAPDGQFLRVNRKLSEMLGDRAGLLLKQRYQQLTLNEDRQREQSLIEFLLVGGIDHYQLEKRVKRADGSELWTQTTMSLKRDRNDAAEYLIAVIEDIGARKQIEGELRLAAQVVRDAADAIITTDLDGIIRDMNPAAESLLECRGSDVASQQPLAAFVLERERQARAQVLSSALGRPVLANFEAMSRPALESGRDVMEWTLCCASGREVPVLVSMTVLRDEREHPIGFIANLVDISSQRASQEALRLERNRARWYLDTVQALIVSLDRHGRVTLVNRFARDLLGLDEADLASLDWFSRCLPLDCVEQSRVEFSRAMESGPETLGGYVESPIRAADGAQRLIGWNNSLVRDESGRVTGLLAAGHDITERRALESARAEAVAEAERLAALKSAFLANMSHEIRTPLHALLGLARMGQRPQAIRPHLELFKRIETAGEHLLGLINDVLDLSRLEAGKLQIMPTVFRLSDQVSQAAAMVQPQAQAKRLALAVDVDPAVPEWVLGDPLRLGQILINLLGNAVKFTEAGQVALLVGLDDAHIRFTVRDTGIGIAPEDLERLFSPFEQADLGNARRFGGSGLGLAISRTLAEMMGGELTAQSWVGAGSQFRLTLPLPPAAKPEHSEPLVTEDRRPQGRLAGSRLLVVDDVEVNRLICEDLLRQEGATVQALADGATAVDLLTKTDAGFDAVLMDIQMPDMDGYEATRRLHAQRPDLPVLGLTAHSAAEVQARASEAGMVACLSKPLDSDRLIAALSRWGRPRTLPRAAGHSGGERMARGDEADAGDDVGLSGRGIAETATGSAQAWAPEGSAPTSRSRRSTGPSLQAPAGGLIDWDGLVARFSASPGFLEQLLATGQRSAADARQRLQSLEGEQDLERLYRQAHQVKGIAGNLCAWPLHGQADELCKLAKGGDLSALERRDALVLGLDLLLKDLDQGIPTDRA